MDPAARAKYLNSPETELFDKGRSLYNHAPAREAAGKGQPLIVAEGYMDVIALADAGFGAAVAPLGTAVTADQLQLMWRISDEPVIALDGDKAGHPRRDAGDRPGAAAAGSRQGAALRAAAATGQDPDDLIRASAARRRCRRCSTRRSRWCGCCGGARPRGAASTAPSARRRWTATCAPALKTIRDPSIRAPLRRGDRAGCAASCSGPCRSRGTAGDWRGAAGAGAGLDPRLGAGRRRRRRRRGAARGADPGGAAGASGGAADVEAALERVELADPAMRRWPRAILRHGHGPAPLRARGRRRLGAEALEKLYAQAPYPHRAGVATGRGVDRDRHAPAWPRNWPSCAPPAPSARDRTRPPRISPIWPTRPDLATGTGGRGPQPRHPRRGRGQDRLRHRANGARVSRDEKAAFEALLDQISVCARRRPQRD